MEKAGADPVLDLEIPEEDLSEYSEKDLQDIIQLTTQTLNHWKFMLTEIPAEKEGLRMAVQASISQSEADIQLYEAALSARRSSGTPQQNLK